MSAGRPGAVRRLGMTVFRVLPARLSWGIVHLAAPTFSIGAVALVEHDGRILTLRQLHRGGWTLPGGLVDRGEQPHEAVVRELREETGLRIEPGDVFATVVDTEYRHVDVIYRVQADREPQVVVASEATGAAWFRPDEVPEPDQPTQRILEAVRAAHTVPQAGRVVLD
ncbi:ADP-ribose pyrophosphatase YjhB (NUDIX family) [Barrientosiimonas humi]|uniref:ADP-ribose pyrophosphatase YjhB (NUDIX family) n=1 Tax=Barrientosiimonas humi TaxID=999931 RepID=A0A542XFI0_9MICO|nr:NUDIX domain-containing protein [Barrientosiimonas humi]TQL34579.1 ADP-ribose pyrophosphatase YjhB (NUDIX family) [Barrientosiimonas humi]CAG7574569.1 RNA pyrophosphohydrolase [Barrientosiimonas humi]